MTGHKAAAIIGRTRTNPAPTITMPMGTTTRTTTRMADSRAPATEQEASGETTRQRAYSSQRKREG